MSKDMKESGDKYSLRGRVYDRIRDDILNGVLSIVLAGIVVIAIGVAVVVVVLRIITTAIKKAVKDVDNLSKGNLNFTVSRNNFIPHPLRFLTLTQRLQSSDSHHISPMHLLLAEQQLGYQTFRQ